MPLSYALEKKKHKQKTTIVFGRRPMTKCCVVDENSFSPALDLNSNLVWARYIRLLFPARIKAEIQCIVMGSNFGHAYNFCFMNGWQYSIFQPIYFHLQKLRISIETAEKISFICFPTFLYLELTSKTINFRKSHGKWNATHYTPWQKKNIKCLFKNSKSNSSFSSPGSETVYKLWTRSLFISSQL